MNRKTITDTVLIVVCTASLGMAAAVYFRPAQASGLGSAGLERGPAPDVSELVGKVLPSLLVHSGDGTVRPDGIAEAGGVTLVTLFRSTCPACEMTAPTWKALSSVLQPGSQHVVVSVEGADVATRWLERHELQPSTVLFPSTPTDLASQWQVAGVPMTLIVDANRVVRFAFVGAITEDSSAELEQMLVQYQSAGK